MLIAGLLLCAYTAFLGFTSASNPKPNTAHGLPPVNAKSPLQNGNTAHGPPPVNAKPPPPPVNANPKAPPNGNTKPPTQNGNAKPPNQNGNAKPPPPPVNVNDAAPLNPAQQAAMVNSINHYRSQLATGKVNASHVPLSTGSNIYKYVYNTALEKAAQAYVNTCGEKPSPGLTYILEEKQEDAQLLVDAADYWWDYKEKCVISKTFESITLRGGKKYNGDVVTLKGDDYKICYQWLVMASAVYNQVGCAVSYSCGPIVYKKDPVGSHVGNTTFLACNFASSFQPKNGKSSSILGITDVYMTGSPCTEASQCILAENSTCEKWSGLCVAPA